MHSIVSNVAILLMNILSWIFRSWWFEPAVATVSFWFFIRMYWYHESKEGLARDDYNNRTMWTISREFYALVAYWIGIGLFKVVIPPVAPVIPDGIPSNWIEVGYLILEIVIGIMLYDAIFFIIHWSMHEIPAFRFIHSKHHEHIRYVNNYKGYRTDGTVECRDVVNHSLLDGSLQVLVNIFVQRNTPLSKYGYIKTRLARVLHNIIVIWMLTESHCASPTPNIWRRWFIGVRQHINHHNHIDCYDNENNNSSYTKKTKKNESNRSKNIDVFATARPMTRYQQFFGYLDDIRFLLSQVQGQSSTTRLENVK